MGLLPGLIVVGGAIGQITHLACTYRAWEYRDGVAESIHLHGRRLGTSSLPSTGIIICKVDIWMYISRCCVDLKFSLYEFK